ncbi:hypothetical protein SAMN05216559_1335 [Halomicrobium zhouii]|uniref:Uncharacterized protein n=1 Tax=Halomicrobium zhouii TaxID=767519 RepID=A0A1I6KQU1_9EURY|nr:hypothetical protein [Halomicrobium zhouii]SFR93619.1 hypothetical protein SAMN05216559_1335 [Halomicrobium zhouii]
MDVSPKKIKLALLTLLMVPLIALVFLAGLADGGPFGPVQGTLIALFLAGVYFLRGGKEFLTAAQTGVALTGFVLVISVAYAAAVYAEGGQVSVDSLATFGFVLVLAIGYTVVSGVAKRYRYE